jgi:hypothetical protein
VLFIDFSYPFSVVLSLPHEKAPPRLAVCLFSSYSSRFARPIVLQRSLLRFSHRFTSSGHGHSFRTPSRSHQRHYLPAFAISFYRSAISFQCCRPPFTLHSWPRSQCLTSSTIQDCFRLAFFSSTHVSLSPRFSDGAVSRLEPAVSHGCVPHTSEASFSWLSCLG